MEKIIINCIKCNQKLRVPAAKGIFEVTCPTCKLTWEHSNNSSQKIIQLFDSTIIISTEKLATNAIQKAFRQMLANQRDNIQSNFYSIFSDLDDLYNRSDEFATEVMHKAINQAMEILVNNGIRNLTEEQFFERFMAKYENWDKDFEPVATQYEDIFQHTAELDAHRTARRQNRSKWVGLNRQGVYDADAKNLTSNIGHGAFNLLAKGVTAISNSIKKNEIFKNPETVSRFCNGLVNIINAALLGTLDAVIAFKPGTVHIYSPHETSKTEALVENVKKGRIPKNEITPCLLSCIELYPYNQDIYSQLLRNSGGDGGKLDIAVTFFEMKNLDLEKSQLFAQKLNNTDTSTLNALKTNRHSLEKYAQQIDYLRYVNDLNDISTKLKKIEFKNETEKYLLKTPSDCNKNLPIIELYAKSIGYGQFKEWAADIRGKAEETQKTIEAEHKNAELMASKPEIVQLFLKNCYDTKFKRVVMNSIFIFTLYLLDRWS